MPFRFPFTIPFLAAAAFLATFAFADEKKPLAPADGFVISYWVGPPPKFLSRERIAEVKEANFTLAFPHDAPFTVEQNLKFLDYCESVGMKAVVMDGRMVTDIGGSAEKKARLDAIIKDYGSHPALYGYHVVDEPGAGAFAGLGEVVAYIREKDPTHLAYINLLPTYGRDFNVLGTKTYEEYVRQYVEKVKPSVICYDHYNLTGSGDRSDFFENLDTVRKVSIESGIPFWNIVLVTQHFAYRHLNAAELSFEAMQTLAFGAKGLLWFTYWMPAGVPSPEGWKHSMILADGSRDPHYDMVKRLNADVLAIAKEIGDAKSVAVYQPPAKPAAGQMPLPADAPLSVTSNELTVGVFRAEGGKQMALLANRNYKAAASTRIDVRRGSPESFDPRTGKWSPMKDPAQSIEPGAALLLRW